MERTILQSSDGINPLTANEIEHNKHGMWLTIHGQVSKF